MAGKYVGQGLEPVSRHSGQHPPFVGNSLVHNHVERRDAVGCDHQEPAVARVENVADFAGMNRGQINALGAHKMDSGW